MSEQLCPTCGSREKWLRHSPAPHSLGSYTRCRDTWHDTPSAPAPEPASASPSAPEWARQRLTIDPNNPEEDTFQLHFPEAVELVEGREFWLTHLPQLLESYGRQLEQRLAQAEVLFGKIAKQVNKLPSVTGWSPVKNIEDIPMAIADLQECYGDAAKARNGLYTKAEARAEQAEQRLRGLVEFLSDRERVGKIMHESWSKTKREQGFHGPDGICQYTLSCTPDHPCKMFHADLVPWEELPEPQKDINRHAFDAVIEATLAAAQKEPQ